MKRILLLSATVALALISTSCGNKRPKMPQLSNYVQDSTLQADLEKQVDSLFSLISAKLPTHPFIDIKNGKFTLTEQQKKVRPTYLLPLDKADNLQTFSQKNIALKLYVIDRAVAEMYGMSTEGYDAVIAELIADVNIQEFPFRAGIDWQSPEAPKVFLERTNAVIREQKEKGQLNYFVERVAASLIECSFLLSQAPEVYSEVLTDQDLADLSYELAIMTDIVDKMSIRYPNLIPIRATLNVLKPLHSVSGKQEFLQQLKGITPALKVARNTILD